MVSEIIYFSDGCAGQYKNWKIFLNLCLPENYFGIPADWHFFATSHGKSPLDGIGNTIRREATRASLQRSYKDQIVSPQALFEFVNADLKGINVAFVRSEELNADRTSLGKRFENAKQ